MDEHSLADLIVEFSPLSADIFHGVPDVHFGRPIVRSILLTEDSEYSFQTVYPDRIDQKALIAVTLRTSEIASVVPFTGGRWAVYRTFQRVDCKDVVFLTFQDEPSEGMLRLIDHRLDEFA